MTPSVRTRHLNAWLEQSPLEFSYPALHGFLCARLVGPEQADWSVPLAGLWQGELDEKSAAALKSLINELEAQADEAQLILPSQCRLPSDDPESVFASDQPLSQWSQGFSLGFANWPRPSNLNDPLTMQRFSLAAELCLFRDRPMAEMLHQAAPDAPALPDFLKRSRQGMKAALNTLCHLESAELSRREAAPAVELDAERANRWQGWFDKAARSRQSSEREQLFARIVDDAAPLFDEAFWQAQGGFAWNEPSARPVLAARAGLADSLRQQGKFAAARDEYLALLALCQDDPMGCRYPLSSLYALTGEWHALDELLSRFDEASGWVQFNRVLLIYVRDGADAAAPLLTQAVAANPHIKACLLGSRKLPKFEPEGFNAGSRDEAAAYAMATRDAWLRAGALPWLRQR
ncbi:UPF0149 family protein [Aeromonas simiae]|uniref:UPF0149 family protein n=1 Tax=Aeromonas simiae TaxID=218936 RepID=UPI00266BC60E|nr:UPF0149 family protein [Aeromonas simiae]MDO2947711.1 UPF0149 family protein [Aeromonas simiae]MDO2952331.1 UPF0149 family protein [Aeromonas simiae]MDO2954926.1 UPF0149 family protein [Aeromonas simiae]